MTAGRKRWFRWAVVVGLVLLLALSLAGVSWAIESDDDGIIEADEVINDDLFMSYETVRIDGIVRGNLFVTAETIIINGTVDGDVLVAGNTAKIDGEVGGSVAFAGAELQLNAPVGGSLYSIGGHVEIQESAAVAYNALFNGFGLEMQPGSSVGRDVGIGAQQAVLRGEIGRHLDAEAGALEISGRIGGDVTADVAPPGEDAPSFMLPYLPPAIPSGLRVSEGAEIEGSLTYVSEVEQADAIDAAPGGGVIYRQPDPEETAVGLGAHIGRWVMKRLQELVTLLVLGGLAIWRVPTLLDQLAEKARAKPLPVTGWGLVTITGGYLGGLLAALFLFVIWILLSVVTLGGLARSILGIGGSGLGLVLAILTLLVVYGSKVVIAYLAGRALIAGVASQYADRRGWALIVGVLIYVLIRSIPVLGWLAGALATLAGFGAMWLVFKDWRSSQTTNVVGAPEAESSAG
jgi:cytoskeletal protein CcmA (bactofilin family)